MANSTVPTKNTGDQLSAAEVNNIVTAINTKADTSSLTAHTTNTSNPHAVTKAQVGLANVQNVDQTNPSNIVQDATHRFVSDTEKNTWNSKQAPLVSGTDIKTINNLSLLGPGNINIAAGGTIDAAPTNGSSNAVSSDGVFDALALKAPLASPALTGTPTAPTAAPGTNTTQVATTAFVAAAVAAGGGGGGGGTINHTQVTDWDTAVQDVIDNNATYFDNTFAGSGTQESPYSIPVVDAKLVVNAQKGSATGMSALVLQLPDTYEEFTIKIADFYPATGSASEIKMQFSTDGGTTWISSYTATDVGRANDSSATYFRLGQFIGTGAPSAQNIRIELFNPSNALTVTAFEGVMVQYNGNRVNLSGITNAVSAVNAVKFFFNDGTTTHNIQSGRYSVTGVKK